jgi:hypothetical protein
MFRFIGCANKVRISGAAYSTKMKDEGNFLSAVEVFVNRGSEHANLGGAPLSHIRAVGIPALTLNRCGFRSDFPHYFPFWKD